jgi:tetratricopeptide (TPR) repeat protein
VKAPDVDRRLISRAGRRLVATCLAVAALATTAPAGWPDVADLYAGGAWDQARSQARNDQPGARPGEAALWRSRLAEDPPAALSALRDGLEQKRLGKPVRARLALEAAELELGAGRAEEALKVLSPLLGGIGDVPGDVQVSAARALLALGRGPRARELLTAVHTGDRAYGLSRALLGDIAIAQGDGVGALRWYDAADEAEPALRARTVSGRCRALLRAGRLGEVQALAARLQDKDPGSLALSEIRRALRDYDEQEGTRRPTPTGVVAGRAPEATPVVETEETAGEEPTREEDAAPPAAGRFTLQLGAFTDRSRALDLQRRAADKVDDLTMAEGVDARGATVFRLRSGAWDDEGAADAAARAMSQLLGIDVIVVDLQAAEHQGD